MLTRLAMLVWVAWLALAGLMAVMLALRIAHPHFLIITTVLGVMIVAALALLGAGAWRLGRGPRRLHVLACLLLGFAPIGFFAGHILYGLRGSHTRQFEVNLPLKLLIPFGESWLDLDARFLYPQRTEGAKVVMISARVPGAPEQVAAMDRHARALEGILGRSNTARVHWVRGPLMGMSGRAIYAMCLGNRPGEGPVDKEGLSRVDRHEVAHCVISLLCPVGADPPAVLSEGWAEANSGIDPGELATRALDARDRGEHFTLRELTGPEWYGRHQWPVYRQGGPLVNYLVRRFGAERFLWLYTTAHRPTFADDCHRILGVTIDQLDAGYWSDIDRLANKEHLTPKQWFAGLELAPGVDPAVWKAFLDDYFREVEILMAPFKTVRLTAEWANEVRDAQGHTTTHSEQDTLLRSGDYALYRRLSDHYEQIDLTHPLRSLSARRGGADEPWEVQERAKPITQAAYRRRLDSHDREMHMRAATMLLSLHDEYRDFLPQPRLLVVAFDRLAENGRHLVRVSVVKRSPGDSFPWQSSSFLLDADDHFVTRFLEYQNSKNRPGHATYEYDRYEGIPVFRSSLGEGTSDGGSRYTSRMTVLERHFEPTPASEFDPDRLLPGPRVVQDWRRDQYVPEEVSFTEFFWLPLLLGSVSLISGAAAALADRWGRHRRSEAMPTPA